MNQEQLNAIKERVANATPGEWRCIYYGPGKVEYSVVTADEYVAHTYSVNDAEFIAHAREDVPALVAEVEYLRTMLRDTRKVVRQKVKEVKTLQNACKNHKAKQEVLVVENEQLCEAVKEFIDYWATTKDARPLLEIVTDARQALGGESDGQRKQNPHT